MVGGKDARKAKKGKRIGVAEWYQSGRERQRLR